MVLIKEQGSPDENEMIDILNRPLLDTHKTTLYNTLMKFDKQRKFNSKELFPELYEED